MKSLNIPQCRLASQRISATKFKTPLEVVSHMGAMQAQDYAGAMWAVGLRMARGTRVAVEKALDSGQIIRTWPMRGTLHFVAAKDARWMTELLAPRAMASASHRWKVLRLTDKDVAKARQAWAKALGKTLRLDRDAMLEVLRQAGISPDGQRGSHLLRYLSQHGLICGAGRLNGKFAFALLDRWAPQAKSMPREQALAEISFRYFNSRGPATREDFMTWSGLSGKEAKLGLEAAGKKLARVELEGREYWIPKGRDSKPAVDAVYLLPAFDEYLLGYKDRSAVLDPRFAGRVCPGGNGMFLPMVVAGGRVVGTWKRALRKKGCQVTPLFFEAKGGQIAGNFEKAANEYCRFVGHEALGGITSE